MTPFNCRGALSLPHLFPPYRSYSVVLSRLRRHLASASASVSDSPGYSTTQNTHTLMEVVQEVLKNGSAHGARAAIRADRKSYSLFQLIASALDVHNILCSKNISRNGIKDSSFEGINGVSFLHRARVGIVAKPSPEFVAGVFGTWLSGGVAVPLALSYPEAELLHVMNDSDISMILSTKEHHNTMDGISTKCSAHCSLLPSVASMPTEINSQESSSKDVTSSISSLIAEINSTNEIKGDDPALILYTSGTTGKPKGVVHTHKGILSQVQILAEAWGYRSEDQFLHCLPLHHVHGLFNALFAPLYSGSVVEFFPKFSVRGIWQRWRESYPKDANASDEAITVFTGVPTMYTRLLQGYDSMDPDQQCASSYAAKQLRLMMCGSSALPSPLMKRWEEVTGHRLFERYGMTEVENIFLEVKEYWRRPEVTSESFIDGGFFKTGDTVTLDDDGYFIILGRTNADIMKVGGYKLSALEIEAVLLEHEAVLECAVLGLPDDAYGEVICAIIVPKEDAKKRAEQDLKPAITLEALTSWSKDRLAPYKPGAEEEAHRGEQHEAHGHGEPDAPPDVVLHVDDDRYGDREGHADRRVVGVEVGLQDPGPSLLGVPRELIRAERHRARPHASGAGGQEREAGQ